MTPVTDPTEQEAAFNWRVLMSICAIGACLAFTFGFGVKVGNSLDTATKLEAFQTFAEQTYIRKDGMEIAGLKAQLAALNDKMDYMIRQGAR